MTIENPETYEDLPIEPPSGPDLYAELLALAQEGEWREFIEWCCGFRTAKPLDELKEFVELWAQMRATLGLPPGWE